MNALNKQILRLSIPNIVTNITVPLLGLVDLAMMGHLDDPVYIGAIALGGAIFSLIYTGFGFLRMGTTGFTAQAFGSNVQREITLILYRATSVAVILAAMLIILQFPIEWLAFFLLDGSDDVKSFAREYFQIRILAAPATLSLYALHGWFLGMQHAKIPMILAIVINTINILLNFVFIIGLDMTSDGVAMASVIAQYSGLILALIFLRYRFHKFLTRHKLTVIFDWQALKMFFVVNGDIFIRTLLLILSLTFFTSMSARISDKILAINTILFQFFFLFSYFADGFAFAGESLVGKARGAGDKILLNDTISRLFSWGWGAALVTSLLFLGGFDLIIRIMTDNEMLIQQARTYRWWIIILPLTSVAAFIWDGVYIGLIASRAMRNSMIIASLLVYLPAYYLGVGSLHNHALWLALNLFMISRGALLWYMAKFTISRP
ncbi:MAG: MATE family efflux transporter [bacterium]